MPAAGGAGARAAVQIAKQASIGFAGGKFELIRERGWRRARLGCDDDPRSFEQDWRWRLPCIGVYQALTLLSLSLILCITSFALLSASQRLSHRADLPSHGTQPTQPRGRVVLRQAGIRITCGWIFQA